MFFSSCDSLVGDSLVFNEANRGSLCVWENEMALHAMQGNRASSRGEGEVSWVFSIWHRHVGCILELRRGCPFYTGVCLVKSGHLSMYDGHLGKLN